MLIFIRQHGPKLWAAIALGFIIYAPTTNWLAPLNLNDAQLKTLLIIMLAAILWVTEWLPLFLVSFIVLALELVWLSPSLVNLALPFSEAQFFAPFFSNIMLLFMGGFVLSSIMQKASLDARFAYWILKITKGEANKTLLGIIAACAFLSMWMSNTATTAMMLTIVLPIIKRLNVNSPFRTALVLAIPLACNLGGLGTPIGTPPNAIALSYLAAKGIDISFLQWIVYTGPFLILTLLILWFTLLKFYPSAGELIELPASEKTPLNVRQWLTIGTFVVTIIGWLVGGHFGLKTGTVALFPIIVAFWLGLLEQNDFRKLPWDVLFMVAGGIALGVAIDMSNLGVVLVELLPVNGAFQVLLLVLILTSAFLGTVMSNTATAGLLIPLVVSLNLAPTQLMVMILAITFNCSTAMILPVSTPPNAIAFSSGVISMKDLSRMGLLMAAVGIIIGLTVGPLYWFLVL